MADMVFLSPSTTSFFLRHYRLMSDLSSCDANPLEKNPFSLWVELQRAGATRPFPCSFWGIVDYVFLFLLHSRQLLEILSFPFPHFLLFFFAMCFLSSYPSPIFLLSPIPILFFCVIIRGCAIPFNCLQTFPGGSFF